MGVANRPPAAAAPGEEAFLSPCSPAGPPASPPTGAGWRWLPAIALALVLALGFGLHASPRLTAAHLQTGRFPTVAPGRASSWPSLGFGRANPSGPWALAPTGRSVARASAEVPEPLAPSSAESRSAVEALLGALEPPSQPAPPAANATRYVSAPLLGVPLAAGYPAIALRFPTLATSAQRQRGVRGVSFDFVVDSGSSANVILGPVATELALPVVGQQPAGAGAAGALLAAPLFQLGDVQLDHLPPAERFILMTGLQAAALAVPIPAGCAGILGRPFLDSFAAAELRYRDKELRFHAEFSDAEVAAAELVRVPAQPLGITSLLGVTLHVGQSPGLPTLVDTGSPVTILSPAAAVAAGLPPPPPPSRPALGWFGRPAAPPGVVPGLRPAERPLRVSVAAAGGQAVDVGEVTVFVGDLPGFQILGLAGQPAALLGTDVLQRCGTLLLRRGEPAVFLGRPPSQDAAPPAGTFPPPADLST